VSLQRLGIDRLVLSIHQASFPASADDVGHGAPSSERGMAFVSWARAMGFTGVALGPGGITTRENPSPYDATGLSRNPLHLAVGDGAVGAGRTDRVCYAHAWDAVRAWLRDAAGRLGSSVMEQLAARRAASPWIAVEARFEAIAAAVGHDDWRAWPASPPLDAMAALAFEYGQMLADEQHARFAAHARGLGMSLYGDLPVGISHRDRWALQGAFLEGYAMGAPPSRTNPAGQPWDFPVLDPAGAHGAAAFLERRLDRLLDGHTGLRIDHPHGWVCPWVYRTDDRDPLHAVQSGARLHESPDLEDHPALAAYARVRADQIDRSRPRYDDRWVAYLEEEQVDRYAALFDALVAQVRARGFDVGELMVEVLSTCPAPLEAVLARHGLGRFRVTQKARVEDAADVYRGDNAAPADWIMVGNHDTPPLRAVIARWRAAGGEEVVRRARFLGERLKMPAEVIARDDRALATAMLAELFLGPARNVLVFWVDLFGGAESYNEPGVVAESNWSLRVPAEFERVHAEAVGRGDAPDLGEAIAWAVRARTG
jgi:4-alpha-glucanotransferase